MNVKLLFMKQNFKVSFEEKGKNNFVEEFKLKRVIFNKIYRLKA